MRLMRETFAIYTKNIEFILLLSFTIMLPFLVIQMIVVNQMYIFYSGTPYSFLGDVVNAFYMILFSVITQLPFIQFVVSQQEGDEHFVKQSYRTFFKYGFSMFLFGFLYAFSIFIGMTIFIIPGVILAILFFLTPYITVMSDKPARHSWKPAMRLGKKKFIPLFFIVLAAALLESVVGFVLLQAIASVTQSYLAVVLTQALLNMIIFPFVIIYTTLHAQKWHEELVFIAK